MQCHKARFAAVVNGIIAGQSRDERRVVIRTGRDPRLVLSLTSWAEHFVSYSNLCFVLCTLFFAFSQIQSTKYKAQTSLNFPVKRHLIDRKSTRLNSSH